MATAIEPCPFCGSMHLHFTRNGLSYCVVCQSCKAKGPHRSELSRAVNLWNKVQRPTPKNTLESTYDRDLPSPTSNSVFDR